MAIQTVNIGTTPNDGTGDPARTAFTKLNDNFTQTENAASKLVATNAQALAGTAGVLLDAAGGHEAFNQYGVGGLTTDITDANNMLSSGLFRLSGLAVGNPVVSPGHIVNLTRVGGAQSGQIILTEAARHFVRVRLSGGVWVDDELHHSRNMQPALANGLNSPRLMRNVSGATVGSEATTAGSGLRFCDFSTTGVLTVTTGSGLGTWKNVGGTNIDNNEYGLFVRIA